MLTDATRARMVARVDAKRARGFTLRRACQEVGLRVDAYRRAKVLRLVRGGRTQ